MSDANESKPRRGYHSAATKAKVAANRGAVLHCRMSNEDMARIDELVILMGATDRTDLVRRLVDTAYDQAALIIRVIKAAAN